MSVSLPPNTQQPPYVSMTTTLVDSDWAQDRRLSEPQNLQLNASSSHSPRRSREVSPDRVGVRDSPLSVSPFGPADIKKPPARPSRSRTHSATPKSPTRPVFHTRTEPRNLDSPQSDQPPAATVGSALLPKLVTTRAKEVRPSYLKKSPASHSSHGVETFNGPPPSFSTQLTLSQDRLWKPALPEAANLEIPTPSPSQPSPQRTPNDSDVEDLHATDEPKKQPTSIIHVMELQDEERESALTPEEEKDQTLRVPDDATTDEERKASSASSREDLFLKIAKDEEEKGAQTRAERRRSRIGSSFLNRTARDDVSTTSELYSPSMNGDASRPVTQPQHNRRVPRLSLNHLSSAASAHPLDSVNRMRYLNGTQKPSISVPRSTVGRDSMPPSPDSPYGYRRRLSNVEPNSVYAKSNLGGQRSSRIASASVAQRPVSRSGGLEQARVEGTESTISTTAPSTIWDEMDEMKSRIRRLELSGKLPATSAGAMSSANNERPQTATTTVTTVSSSPKHGRKQESAQVESPLGGVPATIHPLLHEALSKARSTVSSDVYQKLEATASDALQLASMMGGGGNYSSGASTVGGTSSAERQVRRRIDSMCRGLTELSIALSTEPPRPVTNAGRPMSRDTSSPALLDSSLRYRRASQEPEDRNQVTPRVQTRLDSRRSSLLHGTSQLNSPRYTSPENVQPETTQQDQPEKYLQSRLNRHSLNLRHRRPGQDGANDEPEEQPRPVSRAMTEVANTGLRYSPRDRNSFSREYTSQHPLPPSSTRDVDSSSPRSPALVSSAIPTRRGVYANTSTIQSSPLNPTNYSPTINTTTPSGLRRYGATSIHPSPSTPKLQIPHSTPTALPEIPSQDYSPSLPRSDSTSTVNRNTSIRQRLGAASSRLGSSVGNRLTRAAAAAATKDVSEKDIARRNSNRLSGATIRDREVGEANESASVALS